MGSAMELMPRPRYLAGEIIKPFVFVLGGMALYLAALYLMVGQAPTAPVSLFLTESAEALGPFVGFLLTVWLFYLVTYIQMAASLSDLWILARAPGSFAGLLRRIHLSLPGSTLVACLITPSSLVRLYRPYLPVRMAMGWRAGDSVQLE